MKARGILKSLLWKDLFYFTVMTKRILTLLRVFVL